MTFMDILEERKLSPRLAGKTLSWPAWAEARTAETGLECVKQMTGPGLSLCR